MRVFVRIKSKNKQSFKKTLLLLRFLTRFKVNFSLFSKKKHKKTVTVLKSPHVNKTAQEQFEYRTLVWDFLLKSPTPFLSCMILKKLAAKACLDTNFEFKFVLKFYACPDNILSDSSDNFLKCSKKEELNVLKFLNFYDFVGERTLQRSYSKSFYTDSR